MQAVINGPEHNFYAFSKKIYYFYILIHKHITLYFYFKRKFKTL